MNNKIRIIIIEDVPTDAELIEIELDNASIPFESLRIENQHNFIKQLSIFNPDIIISDYSLPGFNALSAIKIKNQLCPYIPFILVTGVQSEEIAVQCIKEGADDYILKSSLTRLPTSVMNAITKKRAETESIKALEELKIREEKYRNLFENSIVGMFRASKTNCIITETNEKTKQILGIEQLKGKSFDDLQFTNEKGKLYDLITSENPLIENFEVEFYRSDGKKIWIAISVKLYEKESVVEGVLYDITNNKNSWIQLEKANYELDRFTYHASHDLRSPLRSLQGLIQAAMEEEALEDIRSFLKMMQKSTLKLNNLIDDLLSLARTKNDEPKITLIDFGAEVADCISQLEYMDEFEKIKIETSIIQDFPFYTDVVRLKIIFYNLITNAIKYHRLDQDTPYISIVVTTTLNTASIIIKDNGSGIDQKHINKIFDMFYRASNNSEGTGLGLYLVKSTVEKLSGTINIESAPGLGTTFYIEIPNSPATGVNCTNNKNITVSQKEH